jgi:hypothetical protein
MEKNHKNYYSLPHHPEVAEVLEEKGFIWAEDEVDDNRSQFYFIINGHEQTFSLYDSKNFDAARERLQERMNEKIIPITFKEIQAWQI